VLVASRKFSLPLKQLVNGWDCVMNHGFRKLQSTGMSNDVFTAVKTYGWQSIFLAVFWFPIHPAITIHRYETSPNRLPSKLSMPNESFICLIMIGSELLQSSSEMLANHEAKSDFVSILFSHKFDS
jgi:hypothetical protein